MRTTLTALVVFIALIFAVAEVRRSAPPTPRELAEIQYEAAYSELISDMTEQGAAYMQMFSENRLDDLYARFSEPMKQITSREDLELMRETRIRQLGTEAEALSEDVTLDGPNFEYNRISRFETYEGRVQVLITMNGAGEIVGFTIQPYQSGNDEDDA